MGVMTDASISSNGHWLQANRQHRGLGIISNVESFLSHDGDPIALRELCFGAGWPGLI